MASPVVTHIMPVKRADLARMAIVANALTSNGELDVQAVAWSYHLILLNMDTPQTAERVDIEALDGTAQVMFYNALRSATKQLQSYLSYGTSSERADDGTPTDCPNSPEVRG
jgi:hypothetical protein